MEPSTGLSSPSRSSFSAHRLVSLIALSIGFLVSLIALLHSNFWYGFGADGSLSCGDIKKAFKNDESSEAKDAKTACTLSSYWIFFSAVFLIGLLYLICVILSSICISRIPQVGLLYKALVFWPAVITAGFVVLGAVFNASCYGVFPDKSSNLSSGWIAIPLMIWLGALPLLFGLWVLAKESLVVNFSEFVGQERAVSLQFFQVPTFSSSRPQPEVGGKKAERKHKKEKREKKKKREA